MYQRAYRAKFPAIRALDKIPSELCKTYTGRLSRDVNDAQRDEEFIIYRSMEHSEFILASPLDSEALQQSQYVIGDGTFAYCPRDFGLKQLYVLCASYNGVDTLNCSYQIVICRTCSIVF